MSDSADGVESARRFSPTPSRTATDGTESISGSSEEKENAAEESSEVGDDSMSDLSENYDVFETEVTAARNWRTIEDDDQCIAETIAQSLRTSPLLPFCDDASFENAVVCQPCGVGAFPADPDGRMPLQHCAFQGCAWTTDLQEVSRLGDGTAMGLEEHIIYAHFFTAADGQPLPNGNNPEHWRPLMHSIAAALNYSALDLLLY